MRFRFGLSQQRIAELGEWHFWFAWHPVRLYDNEFAWLEFVQRKCWFVDDIPWRYEHRATGEAA